MPAAGRLPNEIQKSGHRICNAPDGQLELGLGEAYFQREELLGEKNEKPLFFDEKTSLLMGRMRRQPKDEKEAKELERLRNNQQRCRDRKLGLVDEYNKRIEQVKEAINEKIRRQQILLQEFNKLRLTLQSQTETMADNEKAAFEQAAQRIDQLEATFIELQHYVRSHVFNQVGCQINRRKTEDACD